MVKYQDDPLSTVFGALADPTRRAILARLSLGETTVGDLAEPFDMSLPAVSKHLRVLQSAGLIEQRRDGRLRRCRFNAEGMKEADDWIARYRAFWEGRFDALADYLDGTPAPRRQGKGGKADD